MAGRRTLVDRVIPSLLFIAVLGVPDGAIGVVWPSLRGEFLRPVGDLGVLALAGMPAYLVASATTGRTLARFGVRAMLVAAAVVGAAALALFAAAPVWIAVVAACALLGGACGAVDGSVNAHLAANGTPSDLAFVHGVYGVGATAGPLLATVLAVDGPGWRWVYALLVPAALAPALLAWRFVSNGGRIPAVDRPKTAGAARRTPRPPLAPTVATLAAFVAYVGAEAATGAWAYTLLTAARGVDGSVAGVLVATYWGGLMVGRFLLATPAATRWAPRRVLTGGIALAAVAVAWLWLDPAGTGGAALPIAGLGFAGVFPLLVSLTPEHVGRDASDAVVGYAVAAAAVGGPVGTAAVGLAAGGATPAAIGPALAATTAVLVVAHVVLARVTAPA